MTVADAHDFLLAGRAGRLSRKYNVRHGARKGGMWTQIELLPEVPTVAESGYKD
jgi:hypothetical protein